MTDHRARVIEAKEARNSALVVNAMAEDQAGPRPYSDADLAALRLAVDVAALDARRAGVDISDLVGPSVGRVDA